MVRLDDVYELSRTVIPTLRSMINRRKTFVVLEPSVRTFRGPPPTAKYYPTTDIQNIP